MKKYLHFDLLQNFTYKHLTVQKAALRSSIVNFGTRTKSVFWLRKQGFFGRLRCVLFLVSCFLFPVQAKAQGLIGWSQDDFFCIADVGEPTVADPATEDYGTLDFHVGSYHGYGIYPGLLTYKYGPFFAPEVLFCDIEEYTLDYIYPRLDTAFITTSSITTGKHGIGPWGWLMVDMPCFVSEYVLYKSKVTVKYDWYRNVGPLQMKMGSGVYTQNIYPSIGRKSWYGILISMI